MKKFISVTALWVLAAGAQAHPGPHGPDLLPNLWHLISQPDHLLLFFVLAIPVAAVIAYHRSRRAKVAGDKKQALKKQEF